MTYTYAGSTGPATVTVDGDTVHCTVHAVDGATVDADIDGLRERFHVETLGPTIWVDSPTAQLELHEVPRFVDHDAATAGGGPTAPVPGTVVAVHVAPGDTVHVTLGRGELDCEVLTTHKLATGADAEDAEGL